MLNAATDLTDLQTVAHGAHSQRDGAGMRLTIDVSDRYQIAFEWRDGNAYDVDIVSVG